MVEPWFNPNLYAWIPGALLGVTGGIEGTLAGLFAPKGKHRTLVMTMHSLLLLDCVGLLSAGIVALATGQPHGIWYGLGFAGLLGLPIFAPLTWVIRRQYVHAELRKPMAEDL